MASRKFHLHDGQRGAALAVRVTPRASRNEITEIQSDGTVKIRLAAVPVEGEANHALIDFMAEVLGVPPTKLDIVAGLSGKDKLISVLDMDMDEVHRRVVAYLE
jgi:uncharacterized protein (TIGR00251 family)